MTLPKPVKENTVLTEQFFSQVSDSIQLIFDLTSRIDERVKILAERHTDLDVKVDKIVDQNQVNLGRLYILEARENLDNRVKALEVKHEMISMKIGTQDNRLMLLFDAIWKMGLMLVAGYILFKLGIQAPTTL